jgi:hypothetical protein
VNAGENKPMTDDDEIKVLLIKLFEAVGIPVSDIELRKNEADELEAIILIHHDHTKQREEN